MGGEAKWNTNALSSLLVSKMRLSASLAAFIGEKRVIFFDFRSDPLGILDNLELMTFVITFERYFCLNFGCPASFYGVPLSGVL